MSTTDLSLLANLIADVADLKKSQREHRRDMQALKAESEDLQVQLDEIDQILKKHDDHYRKLWHDTALLAVVIKSCHHHQPPTVVFPRRPGETTSAWLERTVEAIAREVSLQHKSDGVAQQDDNEMPQDQDSPERPENPSSQPINQETK